MQLFLPLWQQMLSRAGSFNQITVDGDTSTNDTLLALVVNLVPQLSPKWD